MAGFDCTRPTSEGSLLLMVGSGNAWDVNSTVPDLSTVTSYSWPSGATSPALWYKEFQTPAYAPDSYYEIGIRIEVSGLSDDYWSMEYSVDSGQSFTTWLSSYGNVGATTFTVSVAATNTPTFFQVGVYTGKTKGADTAFVNVSDVWAIGSALNPVIGETFERNPYNTEGITDDVFRVHGHNRVISS